MSRSVSLTFLEAVNARETNEVFLVLLELDHESWSTPLLFVNNTEDVVSNGDTYVAYPFTITLPTDTEEDVPTAQLSIDNIDRSIGQAIRELTSPLVGRMMVVLASDPDTVEADFPDFELTQVKYDALTVTGTFTIEAFLVEPFPGDKFVPSLFPGLF